MAGKLIHEVLPVGLLQCNCSILGDTATGDAIVVDPGDEVERILEIIRRHNLKVRAIISTHTHIDHVGGLATLHKATGAPVMVHEADLTLYANLETQAEWLGVPTPAIMRIRDVVKEGDTVRWGGFAARVLHTPGHTPGSISLLVEPGAPTGVERDVAPASRRASSREDPPNDALTARRLLAGDTLFHGSIGRTDLPGGSFPEIIKSIREKLLVLPESMVVLPGHGEATTIGFEREHNPFLV
ncbi:MAG TPA: MBL fold metallo-hydrolase [Verrucomicrobiae bacterium]|nr:MBL fold metallo-hydrolase [Verrucomicrobiae bacterium]